MTTQTVHLHTFDYGASLDSATLRNLADDTLVATADTTSEVTADSGLYACIFGEASAIAAGTYRLRAIASGMPINRYVTLAGTNGEVVQASETPATGGGGEGGLTSDQNTKLTEIHEACYPPDPDDSPLVITPDDPGKVTGYAVCYGLDGEAAAGIVVTYKLQSPPARDVGRILNGSTTGTRTSAENGLITFPGLFPGSTYYFTCGSTTVSITIPLDADSEAGYELPSLKKT